VLTPCSIVFSILSPRFSFDCATIADGTTCLERRRFRVRVPVVPITWGHSSTVEHGLHQFLVVAKFVLYSAAETTAEETGSLVSKSEVVLPYTEPNAVNHHNHPSACDGSRVSAPQESVATAHLFIIFRRSAQQRLRWNFLTKFGV
jgi:hypothetical protein